MSATLDKKRTSWIDIAKGIAILLVFLGHTISLPYEIARFIYFFHMPTFFLLSGYCFNLKSDFGKFVIGKLKGIILPVFTLGLTGSIVVSLMLQFVKHENVDWKWVFLNPVVQYGEHDLLWYLPALFVALLCFYWIVKLCRQKAAPVIAVSFVIALLSYLFTKLVGVTVPWHVDTALIALPFLALGYVAKVKNLATKVGNVPCLVISAVMCALLGFINMKYFGVVEMHVNSYGNILLFYLSAVAGICMVVALSILISESRLLEFFGRNTLVFYSLEPIQYFVNFASGLVVGMIPFYDSYMVKTAVAVVAMCLVAVFSSIAANVINKYFPFLIGQKRR